MTRLYCPVHDDFTDAIGDEFACCVPSTSVLGESTGSAPGMKDHAPDLPTSTAFVGLARNGGGFAPQPTPMLSWTVSRDGDEHVELELTWPAWVGRGAKIIVGQVREGGVFHQRVTRIAAEDMPAAAVQYSATLLFNAWRPAERRELLIRIKPLENAACAEFGGTIVVHVPNYRRYPPCPDRRKP